MSSAEPLLNGITLVGLSIHCGHRICHDRLGDGAHKAGGHRERFLCNANLMKLWSRNKVT